MTSDIRLISWVYVLGSSSIWTFHILNICCCFLLLSTVEKIKTNIRNLTRPNSWATKDIIIEYLNEVKYSAFFTAVMDLFSCNVLRPGDWFVINCELGKVASYCASNGRKSNLNMANFNIKPNSYIPSSVKAPRSDPPPELSLAGRADHKPFLFGICIASCMAEAVTFPIDTLKTRLQLPGMLVKNYLNYYSLLLKKSKTFFSSEMVWGI